jgi:predicted phage terminase large subunit-like protein
MTALTQEIEGIDTPDILEREISLYLARNNLIDFVQYNNPLYDKQWFHELECKKFDDLLSGKIQKLMIFQPPQTGKTEIMSRNFPAYALGKFPDLKIASVSFAASWAERLNRDVQRIIDTPKYRELFPDTTLNTANVKSDRRGSWLRNSEIFEIVNHRGVYKSVGIMGPLTGDPCDIGLLDDVIKDRLAAQSETYRNRLWEWYLDVYVKRCHNNTRTALTMTRWHEDDLAGRILNKEKDWEVVSLPGIKENNDNLDDHRQIGEALWEAKHSRKSYLDLQAISDRSFTSMIQQRPAPSEGDMFKSHWPRWFTKESMPVFDKIILSVDASFTDNKESCPASIQAWGKRGPNFYMLYDLTRRMGAIETAQAIERTAKNYPGCIVVVEKAANGYFIIEHIKNKLPVYEFDPKRYGGKEIRAEMVAALWETGNVFIYDNSYNRMYYLPEILTFPNSAMKDRVDAMSQALLYYTRSMPQYAVLTQGVAY